MKEHSQVKILRKKIFWAPNGSQTHDLPDTYRLDALTAELWETRGEQGHILGCYVWHVSYHTAKLNVSKW